MIDGFRAVDTLNRWYVNYDEGRFDVLEQLVTDDADFSSRSDTGKHPLEASFRCHVVGRGAALAWTREHRLKSPYPLRHNIMNAYLAATRADEIDLEAYMFVTTIVDGRPYPMSSGLCRVTVRSSGDEYRLAAKHVVLDTLLSVPFRELKREVRS